VAKGFPLDVPGGFYHPVEMPTPGGGKYVAGGLSLRDWFAGQALAGIASRQSFRGIEDALSRNVYAIADAMLKEREK
jgi:hypothetical protein